MRRRCALSAFFVRAPPTAGRGVATGAAEVLVGATTFLARGARACPEPTRGAFFAFVSPPEAEPPREDAVFSIIEPAEYAPLARKNQLRGDGGQKSARPFVRVCTQTGAHVSVARVPREPHTCVMVGLGLVVFALECVFAVFFSVVFWHFWTHSAMKRSDAMKALAVYAIGCVVFLLLTLCLPL